jgi:hypothetical protein
MFIKLTGAFTLAFAVVFVAVVPIGHGRAVRQRSTRDRVYSESQAERGKQIYVNICLQCHEERMWGGNWTGRTVADAFDTIKTFMPENDPGSLTAEQVRDVLAYILQTNSLPSGSDDLPDSYEGLQMIRMEPAS